MNDFEFVKNTENSKSEFEKSLEVMSAADIAPKKEKELIGLGRIAFNIFRYGLLFIFIGIFLYNSFNIVSEMVAYSKADDLYSDLAERFKSDDFAVLVGDSEPLSIGRVPTPVPSFDETMLGTAPEEEVSSGGGVARAKIEQLKQMNAESVAWIMVDGTKIDLPVVKGEDNEKYLDIAFDGTKNLAGSLFMDYRNSGVITENKNTLIYGHNMEGGQMFSHITKFLDERFFYDNRYVTLYSDEGIFTYEIFSIYKTHEETDSMTYVFDSGLDFVDYCYKMKSKSVFSYDIEFSESDRVLSLFTCTNGDAKERYCLQAKQIRFEK